MQSQVSSSKKLAAAEEKLSPSLPAARKPEKVGHSKGKQKAWEDDNYPHNRSASIIDHDRQKSPNKRQTKRHIGLSHDAAFRRICAARDMLYVTDQQSNRSFLVDTGAAVSLIPYWGDKENGEKPDMYLTTADGTPIRTYGVQKESLKLGENLYMAELIRAEVNCHILGADFLASNDLLVDVKGKRLVHKQGAEKNDKKPIGCTSSSAQSSNIPQIAKVAPPPYLQNLLTEFSDISGSSFSGKPPQHGITHTIETSGKPCHAKPRRLDEKRLKIAKEEFAKMEKAGIIERANSPWSSPLHMVPKPDGSWRPCGDYRVLNTRTVPDHYPLPHIADFTQRLHGCKIFTKLDLVKAYYQIPMAEEDRKKTCIVTPFGSFIFKVMPFGLLNSGATFQRVIDKILGDIQY